VRSGYIGVAMPAAAGRAIYVQIDIAAPVDRVWELTQSPEQHRRWDLRFSTIEYLPRPDPALPQRFLYATRLGFGLLIRGEGESVGVHDGPDGRRSSALEFSSADPKSLIRDGSGYWQYVPLPPAVAGEPPRTRFLTSYNYAPRFGLIGRLVDRLAFRPLIAWATAWSFDRLRLWVERGIDPAAALRASAINAVSRSSLALVWIYQGLVPKLLARDPAELAMLRDAGVPVAGAGPARAVVGVAEVALGLLILLSWRSRWPLWVTLAGMPLALLAVALQSPAFLTAAFNPVSLNAAVFALAAVCLLGDPDDLPSAARCVRTPPREGPP